ncbi:unnamed protein product [Rhizopus stolonifer]
MTTFDHSLKQILEKSKLTNHGILEGNLPTIERGLNQIDIQSKHFSEKNNEPKSNSASDERDARVHYFLAQGGVDTQALIKELGTIHLGASTEHRQPILDTDIEGYFEKKHTQTIMDLIQDGREQISNDTKGAVKKDIDSTWTNINIELSSKLTETRKFNVSMAKIDPSRIVGTGVWQN